MIKHQQQPTGTTCSQTVIAMALGIPVEKVIENFGGEPMTWDQAAKALVSYGVFPKQVFDAEIVNCWGKCGLYTLAVPSLNIKKGWHLVLLDLQKDRLDLYDPVMGIEGKQAYTSQDMIEGACGFAELTYLDFELLN